MSQNFEEILLPIKSELKKMESYIEHKFKKDHFFIAEVGNYVVQLLARQKISVLP